METYSAVVLNVEWRQSLRNQFGLAFVNQFAFYWKIYLFFSGTSFYLNWMGCVWAPHEPNLTKLKVLNIQLSAIEWMRQSCNRFEYTSFTHLRYTKINGKDQQKRGCQNGTVFISNPLSYRTFSSNENNNNNKESLPAAQEHETFCWNVSLM